MNKNISIKNDTLWVSNEDCFKFLKKIPESSVDLILTDPPFGLNEREFDKKHYNRNHNKILDGYVEAPKELEYGKWSYKWIKEFNRILKPNGSILIFSGWTHEADIQFAFRKTNKFKLINHLIWNYNFGVYTKSKFVTSHYHILYYCKKNGKPFFNKNAYHNEDHKNTKGGSLVYDDLQDVIKINKEYKPKQETNSNQLPIKLIEKLIKHTTEPNNVVLDIFSGNFTTQKAALKLNRKAWGCEINTNMCLKNFQELKDFNDFYTKEEDIIGFKKSDNLLNQGKVLSSQEKENIIDFYSKLNGTKKDKIKKTSLYFKRGCWSIQRIINNKNY